MPPALADLLRRLADHPAVRRAAWLAFLSWVAALTLTGYVFGFTDGFFGRLFSATLVLWLLAAGTAFGILPLIGWLTHRLSDDGGNRAPRGRRTQPRRAQVPPPVPANKWR